MDSFETRMSALNELIKNSKKVVFFGGAGVSTESGIPDFRSKDGLYNQHDVQFDQYTPEYLLSRSCLKDNPDVFFEFYRQKLDCREIEPNVTHKVLAQMEKDGKLIGVVTQNIDGLHQKAGSENVFEIHGTTARNYCANCGQTFFADHIFECGEPIPHCECGGVIRPDVTLYEESLPEDAWYDAQHAINEADLIIIGGTSLSVYPAANLVQWRTYGAVPAKKVIINRDETDLDYRCDLVFHESLGEVFSCINYEV